MLIISAKDAKEKLKNVPDNTLIFLDIVDVGNYVHQPKKSISYEEGEKLIDLANEVQYQNNDFFGLLSLIGVTKDVDKIHNVIFPQRE